MEGQMSKGDQTRTMIMRRSAPVFNRLGYFGASLSDIMAATGLEKGGIYNHFASKEALAEETFDYAVRVVGRAMLAAVRDRPPGLDQLEALLEYYVEYVLDPPVAGGCPLLNTAVESDDANLALRLRAQKGMQRLERFIGGMLSEAKARSQVRPGLDLRAATSFLIASLEGGVMLTRLYGDVAHMRAVVEQLKVYVEEYVRV
jgi:TetR/AcrR family transcriptional repressor of nem operon